MRKHDEPNEYGFAGDPTLPEPPPKGQADEQDRAEEVAVPGDDITESVSEAIYEETDDGHAEENRR
ncbi:hypothetical protein ACIBTV_21980 [Micromonospora sp. NPDC049366]|uniref:Uncharacterized protein n=1 Tax=Micromonospora krabiensis TaxID=307121 RepID=A0A1C3N0Z6_9ACTN|nr:hypothetical protein [Micromonospora krabiensis]SBV26245.1 hypothetical protein GA0070620_1731 [Micromonospora krabiensis]